MEPNPVGLVSLYKEETHTGEAMETEIGVTWPQVQGCLEPPEIGRDPPQSPQREHGHAHIWTSDFRSPNCESMLFCGFKPPGLWSFVLVPSSLQGKGGAGRTVNVQNCCELPESRSYLFSFAVSDYRGGKTNFSVPSFRCIWESPCDPVRASKT